MNNFKLVAKDISKFYQRGKWIFRNVELDLESGKSYAITGRNGSGKSTLLKIIAGQLSLSKGKIGIHYKDEAFDINRLRHISGYIAPYYNLYEEFTPYELLAINSRIRNISYNQSYIDELLEKFAIHSVRNSVIRTFSSGMKQRLKFVNALFSRPDIMFLDEPSTNLDLEGIQVVEDVVKELLNEGKCIVIASNDEREKSWCSDFVDLNLFKNEN